MKHQIHIILSLLMVSVLIGCQQNDENVVSKSDATNTLEGQVKSIAKAVDVRAVAEAESIKITKEYTKSETFQELAVEDVVKAPVEVVTQPVKEAAMDAVEKEKVKVAISGTESVADVAPLVKEAITPLGDPIQGAKLAKRKCAGCHYFDKNRKKIGPSLKGIYGKAPTIDGVPFLLWDDSALDTWLRNPKAVKKKTKMSFRGISNERKRKNIIAFLRGL